MTFGTLVSDDMSLKLILSSIIVLFSLYSGETTTIEHDSLKFFVGELEIIEKMYRENRSYTRDYKITTDDFTMVLFKPREYEPNYRDSLPKPSYQRIEKNEIRRTIYMGLPYQDKYLEKRILYFDEHDIILTLLHHIRGFENIYYAVCFWEIDGEKLNLIHIVDRPLIIGIGRINIIDCIELENNSYALILHSLGADGGYFWGNYSIHHFSIGEYDQFREIYKAEYGGGPKEHTKIEHFNINYSDKNNPIVEMGKVYYKSESEQAFPTDHKVVGYEKFAIDIKELLKE